MFSETLRLRLEQLNRQTLSDADRAPKKTAARGTLGERPIGSDSAPCEVPQESSPDANSLRGAGSFVARTPAADASPLDLASAEVTAATGRHALLAQPLECFWPALPRYFAAWQERRANDIEPIETNDDRLTPLAEAFPSGTLFLDLETCGLAGSMVFLAGLVRFDGERLVLEQLLARDYSEERPILESLWRAASNATTLVTFNGKSFDWPLVHDRSTYHRLGRDTRDDAPARSDYPRKDAAQLGPGDARPILDHFDLLHAARRRWRTTLPNCRLQTLERFLCGRTRRGDIPGSEIPAAYRRFVASGETAEIRNILHHNALDLLTLVQLAMLMTASPSRDQKKRAPVATIPVAIIPAADVEAA